MSRPSRRADVSGGYFRVCRVIYFSDLLRGTRRFSRAGHVDLRRDHLVVLALLVGDLDLIARLQPAHLRGCLGVGPEVQLLALAVLDQDAVTTLVDRYHPARRVMRHAERARLLRG